MVTGIQATSGSYSQAIDEEIDKIDSLLDVLKKEDSSLTIKKVLDLLIEYILAKMSNADTTQTDAIQNQISETLKTYSTDIQDANSYKSTLNSIKSNPSDQTESMLQKLQNLEATLEKDALSKDTSILQSLPVLA
jgi:phosphoglycerate-specific signal transduction histidine kinase